MKTEDIVELFQVLIRKLSLEDLEREQAGPETYRLYDLYRNARIAGTNSQNPELIKEGIALLTVLYSPKPNDLADSIKEEARKALQVLQRFL